ncbi:MAG: electron transfer flavoprotein subunit beta/FixA family protein [Chitinophagales bacterium]
MKILVCISVTPDTTAKIEFVNNNTAFNTNNVNFILNPTDEWYALVRALEIKEQLGGSVTVIHVGEKSAEKDIRKALAIGADNAVRVNTQPTDAYVVASEIAAYAQSENFDLIFTGKETIDYNGFSVGGMLAELLDMPYIQLAMHLDIVGNTATIDREIEGGVEKLTVDTPFVVSAQKGMAEQRIPNMRGIMMARRKPLKVVASSGVEALVTITEYAPPPPKSAVKLVDADNAEDLIRLLHEEAKVI